MLHLFHDVNGLHDPFMEQRLADVAVEKRHAAYAQTSQGKRYFERKFIPAPAADIIESQLVKIHDHYTGAHKQRKLEQRVVDHVLHSSGKRRHHGFFFAHRSHEHCHGNSGQNETDLGHGRAGQRSLEIDREQSEDSAEKHSDQSGRQDDQSESVIARQDIKRRHQDSVDAHLGQDARQKCGGR